MLRATARTTVPHIRAQRGSGGEGGAGAYRQGQYTAIEDQEGTFTPIYDDDGNQTRIKTSTGIWNVTYNDRVGGLSPPLLDYDRRDTQTVVKVHKVP